MTTAEQARVNAEIVALLEAATTAFADVHRHVIQSQAQLEELTGIADQAIAALDQACQRAGKPPLCFNAMIR
jgi:hypothetical protein